MVILDATIVNVALPAIQKALGFTNDSQLQWVVTAYALVFGGFLLLGGRLADLFGRRRIFMAGWDSSRWLRCGWVSLKTPRCWWYSGRCRGWAVRY